MIDENAYPAYTNEELAAQIRWESKTSTLCNGVYRFFVDEKYDYFDRDLLFAYLSESCNNNEILLTPGEDEWNNYCVEYSYYGSAEKAEALCEKFGGYTYSLGETSVWVYHNEEFPNNRERKAMEEDIVAAVSDDTFRDKDTELSADAEVEHGEPDCSDGEIK